MKTWLLVLIMVRTVSMKTWKDMEKKCQFLIKCQVQALVLDGVIAQQQPEAKYKWGQDFAWPNSIFILFFWCFFASLPFCFISLLPCFPLLTPCSFTPSPFFAILCLVTFHFVTPCFTSLFFLLLLAPLLLVLCFIALSFHYSLLHCCLVSLLFVSMCLYFTIVCSYLPLLCCTIVSLCHYFLAICSSLPLFDSTIVFTTPCATSNTPLVYPRCFINPFNALLLCICLLSLSTLVFIPSPRSLLQMLELKL